MVRLVFSGFHQQLKVLLPKRHTKKQILHVKDTKLLETFVILLFLWSCTRVSFFKKILQAGGIWPEHIFKFGASYAKAQARIAFRSLMLEALAKYYELLWKSFIHIVPNKERLSFCKTHWWLKCFKKMFTWAQGVWPNRSLFRHTIWPVTGKCLLLHSWIGM